MKGQSVNQIIGIGLALVAFVVVAAITDDIITDASQTYVIAKNSQDSANEFNISAAGGTYTLAYCGNGMTPGTITCYNSTTASAEILSTSYNVTEATCKIESNVAIDEAAGGWWNCSYEYADDNSYSSPLSRTVASFIVPISILGALVLAAGFVYIRFMR